MEANQNPYYTYNTNEKKVYEMLCRGEVTKTPRQLAQLKCKYVTNKSAFLKIAPLKLEEANLQPYIVLYHDVMYDSEIEVLKQMAKPRVMIVQPFDLFTSHSLSRLIQVISSFFRIAIAVSSGYSAKPQNWRSRSGALSHQ